MTLDTAAAIVALRARVDSPAALPERLAVSTDTRGVRPGSTFLALRGERFDGHDFVADAFARGAAACVVEDAGRVPAGRPALVVADTLAAYLALGALARDGVRGPVIAISGSAGKTTTKTYLLDLLTAAGIASAATPENENNEIGVAKFLLGLERDDDRIAIVEMGARKFRDLDVLVAAARPTVAVLTNIGEAHVEIMGSPERLAETKWGLFSGGAQAVLNLADAASRERAPGLPREPVWFGLDPESPPNGATAVVLRAAALIISTRDGRREVAFTSAVPGDHNRRNLAAAFAAAAAVGIPPERLAAHAAGLRQPARRYETIPLDGGKRLIFDAYNASMSGTLATLDAFAREAAERRIAVLGSMAELGAEAAAMHRRVGAAAAGASEIILAGGDFAAEIARGATEAGAAASRILTYAENAAAVAWLRANARPGDAILLKGSRKYRMEEIADALRAGGAA